MQLTNNPHIMHAHIQHTHIMNMHIKQTQQAYITHNTGVQISCTYTHSVHAWELHLGEGFYMFYSALFSRV